MASISESVATLQSQTQTYVPVLTIPRDGGYGWVIVTVGFIGTLIFDGLCSSFYIFREAISEDFKVPTLDTAVIGSLFGAVLLFMGPIASGLCNIYGFRAIMIVGSIVSTTGFGVSYFTASVVHLIFTYGFVAGIGMGLLLVPVIVPVNYWFDTKRPIALGIASSGSGIGTIIAPLTLSYVTELYSWKYGVLVEAGFSSVFIILAIFLRPLVPVQLELENEIPGTVNVPKLMNPLSQSGLSLQNPSGVSAVLHRQLTGGIRDYRRFSGASAVTWRPSVQKRAYPWYTCWGCCGCCQKKEIGNRPMYRDDIFYAGSVMRIRSAYATDPVFYSMSVTRLPTQRDLEQEDKGACCPEAVTNVIKRMLNCSLWKDPAFLVIALSTMFHIIGASIPILYITRWCEAHEIPEHFYKWMVPSIGIGSFAGRLSGGVLLQLLPEINALLLSIILNALFVTFTVIMVFCPYTGFMFYYALNIGYCTGLFLPLRSLIMVDYIGLENLTTGSGLLFATMGAATLCSGPLAEVISVGNYKSSLLTAYMSASCVFIGTLIVLYLFRLKKYED